MNLVDGSPKDTFVDIFKNLHANGHLTELYLTGTGIKNIDSKLRSVPPAWGVNSDGTQKLQCDS